MIEGLIVEDCASSGWFILDEQALRAIMGGTGEDPPQPPDALNSCR